MLANPTALRIEASSVCQLRCPLCPTTRGENLATVGRGYLKFDDFKNLIDQNPQIQRVELGNFGEVFLNKDLPKILEYAFAKHVTTTIDEGANLNDASDQALEALVKYQTEVVRCAIDGITQKSYSTYRVRGDLGQVLRNIQKINSFKEKYRSSKPHLIFQFIVFGHNEHEIDRAVLLAKMLKMEFYLKLNFFPHAMPVMDRERVRHLTGYADREEYLEREGKHYKREQCYEMWASPQINWDGKLLGCSRNIWGTFADNVFESGLLNSINNERMQYARKMLMGQAPPRGDMHCLQCSIYQSMAETGNWITEEEYRASGDDRNSWIRPIMLPTDQANPGAWKIDDRCQGRFGGFDDLSVHVSTLSPGVVPHPLHQHLEEELKIVLSGEIASLWRDDSLEIVRESTALSRGSCIYNRSGESHTIRGDSAIPSTYLVVRWKRKGKKNTPHSQESFIFDRNRIDMHASVQVADGFSILPLQDLPRHGNLRGHLTFLQPGAGYTPHADPYDLLIVLLEGAVETLNQRVQAPALVFCASHVMHGVRNAGETAASYLVFEYDTVRPASG